MQLSLGRFAIRDWQPGDEPSIVHHANNHKIWINLRDSFPHPYTLHDAQEWIRQQERSQPRTHFAIVVNGSATGGIGLRLQEDVYRRSAEIGFWLGEEHWGRGIMTEAVRAVVEYAFKNLDLCRVFAGVFEYNQTSVRVLEKAGFILEARLRKSVTKNGKTIDQLLYATIRP